MKRLLLSLLAVGLLTCSNAALFAMEEGQNQQFQQQQQIPQQQQQQIPQNNQQQQFQPQPQQQQVIEQLNQKLNTANQCAQKYYNENQNLQNQYTQLQQQTTKTIQELTQTNQNLQDAAQSTDAWKKELDKKKQAVTDAQTTYNKEKNAENLKALTIAEIQLFELQARNLVQDTNKYCGTKLFCSFCSDVNSKSQKELNIIKKDFQERLSTVQKALDTTPSAPSWLKQKASMVLGKGKGIYQGWHNFGRSNKWGKKINFTVPFFKYINATDGLTILAAFSGLVYLAYWKGADAVKLGKQLPGATVSTGKFLKSYSVNAIHNNSTKLANWTAPVEA